LIITITTHNHILSPLHSTNTMAHPNRLNNTRVLIFGGTSGIGFGIANMALSNNAYVTISGSTQAKVDAKVKELQSFYPNLATDKVSGHAIDLLDLDNLEANLTSLFEKVTEGGQKKIDHIAFTAGDAPVLPNIATLEMDEVLHMFHIRFIGASFIAKLLKTGKYMTQAPSSSYTLTGGTNSVKPMPGWAIGAGVGQASEGLMRGLAVDLKPIRVNLVSPGAIETPLLERYLSKLGPEKVEEWKKYGTLTGTLGSVVDTAEAYGWFMRDYFVTGKVASTDGGRLLAGEH
jgi:NAD(P)-dependent dehydrogenase (short-subunit alcohol dehydrogenase family)